MFVEEDLVLEDVPVFVPEVRGRGSAYKVCVPEGSLAVFPKGVKPLHCVEEMRLFRGERWCSEVVPASTLTFADGVLVRTLNRSLAEQRALLAFRSRPMELLSPYELAYLAALWRERGIGRLFKGRVRTLARKDSATFSYLGGGELTVVAEYSRGVLRFSYEYERCRSKVLGVLAGIRTQ